MGCCLNVDLGGFLGFGGWVVVWTGIGGRAEGSELQGSGVGGGFGRPVWACGFVGQSGVIAMRSCYNDVTSGGGICDGKHNCAQS